MLFSAHPWRDFFFLRNEYLKMSVIWDHYTVAPNHMIVGEQTQYYDHGRLLLSPVYVSRRRGTFTMLLYFFPFKAEQQYQ